MKVTLLGCSQLSQTPHFMQEISFPQIKLFLPIYSQTHKADIERLKMEPLIKGI